MGNKRLFYGSAVLLALLGQPALAEDGAWYVVLHGGIATIEPDQNTIDNSLINANAQFPNLSPQTAVRDGNDSTWKAAIGYRVNRNFALEFGYASLGEYQLRTTTTNPATTFNHTVEINAFSVDALGIKPINDRLSLYGRFGVTSWEQTGLAFDRSAIPGFSFDDRGGSIKVGLGLSYAVGKRAQLRLEWERYINTGEEDALGTIDVDVASVGLTVDF
jgi:opacity protein-like surface antigen